MEEKKIVTTEEELEALIAVSSSHFAEGRGDEKAREIAEMSACISYDFVNHLAGRKNLPQEEIDLYYETVRPMRAVIKLFKEIFK